MDQDVDVMWFRNPFKHVTAYADMSISSDVFFGDPDRIDNFPNTGFFHVRPNNRTIAMTRAWHEARERYPGLNEQPVFNAIKKGLVRDLATVLDDWKNYTRMPRWAKHTAKWTVPGACIH